MFQNCVFKPSVDTKKWFVGAINRAVRTVAQTAIGMLTVGQAFGEIDWVYVVSVSATAGIISILTSVAGIPEVTGEVK